MIKCLIVVINFSVFVQAECMLLILWLLDKNKVCKYAKCLLIAIRGLIEEI